MQITVGGADFLFGSALTVPFDSSPEIRDRSSLPTGQSIQQ
jgi:hypothetical protein